MAPGAASKRCLCPVHRDTLASVLVLAVCLKHLVDELEDSSHLLYDVFSFNSRNVSMEMMFACCFQSLWDLK